MLSFLHKPFLRLSWPLLWAVTPTLPAPQPTPASLRQLQQLQLPEQVQPARLVQQLRVLLSRQQELQHSLYQLPATAATTKLGKMLSGALTAGSPPQAPVAYQDEHAREWRPLQQSQACQANRSMQQAVQTPGCAAKSLRPGTPSA